MSLAIYNLSVPNIIIGIDINTSEGKRLTDFVNRTYRIFSWDGYIDCKISHVSKCRPGKFHITVFFRDDWNDTRGIASVAQTIWKRKR